MVEIGQFIPETTLDLKTKKEDLFGVTIHKTMN